MVSQLIRDRWERMKALSRLLNKRIGSMPLGGSPPQGFLVSSTGTANTIPKYTSASALANSALSDDGTEIVSTEPISITTAGGIPSGTIFAISADAGDFFVGLPANKQFKLLNNAAATFSIDTGLGRIAAYANNRTTAGWGVAAIYAAGAQTLYTNAAPTTLSYTPPATAGVYRISAYLNILTGATQTFKVKVTYKDPGGNAVTDIPDFEQQNSATLLPGGPAANATGRFSFEWVIAIDNSATAITIADNAGTYTAGTYYWTPILEQLA